jgi:hypothetical protein
MADRRRSTEPNASLEISVRDGKKRCGLPVYDCTIANLSDIPAGNVTACDPERSCISCHEHGGRKIGLHTQWRSVAYDVGAAEAMKTTVRANPNVALAILEK